MERPPDAADRVRARLGRSLAGLFTIGGVFVINAFASTYATAASESLAMRVLVIAALVVLNVGLYYAAFALLTPKVIRTGALLPGAIVGAIVFTLLITVVTGLLTHQLKNASNTYGTFGSVIGVVLILLLLSKFSIYAAELNPVLEPSLYPAPCPSASQPPPTGRSDTPWSTRNVGAQTRPSASASAPTPHEAAVGARRDDENPTPEPDPGKPTAERPAQTRRRP